MTDYRLRLLDFLDERPDWFGNILPIIEEYLKETAKTSRLTFYTTFVEPLEGKNYLIVFADSKMSFSYKQNDQYVTDYIHAKMTFEGHDYLEELRKKNLPISQPILMTTDEDLDHAILNFFIVKNDFALLDEMYGNLRSNGFKVDVWNVAPLIKNGCFDEKYEKDSPVHYKINSVGRAMFQRLDEKLNIEKQSTSIVIHGPVNTGHIGGDQNSNSRNVNSSTPKKNIRNTIVMIFIAVVAGLIVWYFTKSSK